MRAAQFLDQLQHGVAEGDSAILTQLPTVTDDEPRQRGGGQYRRHGPIQPVHGVVCPVRPGFEQQLGRQVEQHLAKAGLAVHADVAVGRDEAQVTRPQLRLMGPVGNHDLPFEQNQQRHPVGATRAVAGNPER